MRWAAPAIAIIKTPHLDALAKDGVRFSNAFVTTAICAASRASILTGLYERTHRYTFGTKPITAAHVAIELSGAPSQGRLSTGFVGKFGVGVPPGGAKQMFDSFIRSIARPTGRSNPTELRSTSPISRVRKPSSSLLRLNLGEPFCLSVSFNAPHAEDNDPKQYFWQKEVDGLYRDVKVPDSENDDG